MTVLELPERFLNKEKDLKKNISAITLEDETDKKSKSLFQTYSLNKDTLVDDTKVLELPERFKKNDLNVDFEDNSARLYDKPKTDFINDVRYGWNQSQSGFFHLIANIPGGLDATKDFIGKAPGLGFLNGDGKLAGMESYLRKHADANNPEYMGLDTPDTLSGKILAGFAMTPITLATYAAPIRILKSVPIGMALVDGIRESDKGLQEAAVAAGKGAILGKIIQASNVLRLPERMGALGILGYATAGGNTEDRIAGAVVFGTLGIIGPRKGKTITQVKRDITGENAKYKEIQETKAGEWVLLQEKLNENTKLLNEQQIKIANYKKRKKVNKNTLEGYKKVESDLLNVDKITTDQMLTIERVLHTTDKLAKGIEGKDSRPAIKVLADLFDKTGANKYVDLKGMKHKFSGMALPMKFITKNPITKWTADFMSDIRIGIENRVETILYDPRITPFRTFQTKIDKNALIRGDLSAIKVGGFTALKNVQRQSSDGAALTRARKLLNKDVSQLEHVIQKSFEIELAKSAEAKQNKTKIQEITDAELKTKYKFNKEQIEVYRDLRRGLDNVHKLYNEYIDKYVKTIPGEKAQKLAKKLAYIPNYMPHMFLGDFRVWINKSNNPYKEPVKVMPVNSTWSAKSVIKDLQKKYGGKLNEKGELTFKIKGVEHIAKFNEVKRGNISNRGLAAFEDAMLYAARMGKSETAKDMHTLYTKAIGTRGFRKHSLTRKNIPGQAGSKEGLEGVLQFLNAYEVYVRGGVQKAYAFKARKETNHVLENSRVMKQYSEARNLAMKYRENALGAEPNRISEAIRNGTRKWLGESGAEKALGLANRATLTLKLLFGNVRFMAAQYIQPFQMIPAKLLQLQSKGMKGNVWESVIEAQRSLILPNKQVREAIEYLVNQRVIEPKFLQEFARDAEFVKFGKISIGKSFYFDVPRMLEFLTMKGLAGRVEQYSRMNAGLMFYHFGRRSGKSHKEAMEFSAYNADKYMVEYNSFERPLIYGEAGLGTAGKPFGLFKTFQHNYFAQLTEHFQTIKWGELKRGQFESTKGALAFTGSMIATAGALNVIGIEVADKLITKLSPVWQRVFKRQPQTVTEMLLRSDLPDWVKWGAPSAALDADFTTTLAAPGLGVADLVSVPSLEVLGLHPGQLGAPWFKRRKGGILQTGTGWAFKASMGTATEADAQMFYESLAPTSFKGIIEATYNGGVGVFWDKDKSMYHNFAPWIEKDLTKTQLVRDPWKKSRGKIRRDLNDWRTRLMASYSLKEATYLKSIYAMTVIDKNAKNNQENVTRMAAHLVLNGEEVPQFLFEMALANNVTPKSFMTKIKNRITLMNTDLLQREIKDKNIARKVNTEDLIIPLFNKESSQKTKPNILELPERFTETSELKLLKLPDRFQKAGGGGGGFTNSKFMNALAMAESSGNPTAVSWRGAQGLFQIMPSTARKPGFGITPLKKPFDVKENTRFATDYMNALLKKYNGNQMIALVAWNWGPSNADKWIEKGSNFNKLPGETKTLIRRVLGTMEA